LLNGPALCSGCERGRYALTALRAGTVGGGTIKNEIDEKG